jgi:hypothetical protein
MPPVFPPPPHLVRVYVEQPGQPLERLWGELVAPDRVRLCNVAHGCDLSFCDVVRAEPVCSCDDVRPHYVAEERLARGSRRVQAFTSGTSRKRLEKVAAYLMAWPTEDGSTYETALPGHVACKVFPCGSPSGLVAYPKPEPEERDTHWFLAFPLHATEEEIGAFLDGLPYLAFHELMPEESDV